MSKDPTAIQEEEEILGKAYDPKLVRKLWQYLAPLKLLLVVCTALLLANSLLRLAGPYLTKVAIDDYIGVGNLAGLNGLAALYLAVLLVNFGLGYGQTYLLQLAGQKFMVRLRLQMFSHLQRMSLSYFDRHPVGKLMTRVVNDVEVLNETFTSGVVAIFGDLFTLAGITLLLLWLDWRLALLTFAVFPFLFYTTHLYRQKARETYRLIRTHLARLNAYLQENISGMSTVQVFCREGINFARFEGINRQNRDQMIRAILYNSLYFPAIDLLGSLAIGLILWYGGGQAIQQAILPGTLVAFIQYIQRLFNPLRDLAEKYNIMQAAMAASEKIFRVLDTPQDLPNPDRPVRLGRARGEIAFQRVWFSYDSREPVLKEVSFHVRPGEKVALVGPTGSGKTTIVSLLARFYEIQQGAILLDGVEIRQMDKYELRRQLGIVLQDVYLFSGDLSFNIGLGEPRIGPERVREAARLVNAHTFIERLPEGYGHPVQERGSTLSLGQKQLLALARVLAFDPPILVLDEATASVDTETELLIQEALHRILQGRTALIIAHRLSTLQQVDRILVLRRGKICEQGTHQELLSQRGIYWRLYQLQFRPERVHT